MTKSSIAVIASLGVMTSASGVTIFTEGVDGELSDNLAAPTLLTLGLGANTIAGLVGGVGSGATDGTDADYFRFSLPTGQAIDSIVATRSGPGSQSFIGYRAGTSFTGQGGGDVDAFELFADGESLLPGGLSDTPFEAGDHAFWVQEVSGVTSYSLTLNVVPEPSGFLLSLLGVGVGLLRRQRAS